MEACSTCRARKQKCIRRGGLIDQPCEGCVKHGFVCSSPMKRERPLKPAPPPATNPLDAILPRVLLSKAIDTYFKYVYCLVPVVHRPTFSKDIELHREDRGEDEWVALVISIAALAMAQTPWAFDVDKKQINALVTRCYQQAKRWAISDFESITTTRCVVLYILVIISIRVAPTGSRELFLGTLWHMGYTLRFHEESAYDGLDCIEAEVRRRIYWLAVGFDKASSAVRGSAPMITREHCATTRLPMAIDDDYLLPSGYIEASGGTSILAGFRFISRLYGLFGQLLDMRRLDRLSPPSGISLQMRVSEVDELHTQMSDLMAGCPRELRLADPQDIAPPPDWAEFLADGLAFFEQPETQALVSDTFLVQQANIYVTIQMARHTTVQYRAELHHLRRQEIQQRLGRVGLVSGVSPGMFERNEREELDVETDRTAAELLRVLQSIPIQVLAVNGDSIVNKVRFVAVTQLQALEELSGRAEELSLGLSPAAERDRQRLLSAQSYLFNFLKILSELEELFSIRID